MEKTLVVWRRLGKEHGEDCGYKINSKDIVDKHLNDKVFAFSKTPNESWRWWKVNEKLLIEISDATSGMNSQKTFYYLPQKNWLIVDNFDLENPNSEWKWYIHIGSTAFDKQLNCWVFTDWFSDIIVKDDNKTHSVLDLDELGKALSLGLIDSSQISEILSSTQELIDTIRHGNFPPKEIGKYMPRCQMDFTALMGTEND